MEFKIDLHVHSRNSGDNDADPEETIERAIKIGLDGVAFTEHYSYAASEPLESLREKYADRILILRGVEFSTQEGHCLVFGADTDRLSLKYAPAQEVVRLVTEAGGVVIPSHPYRVMNSLGDAVRDLDGVCALEGYNGCNLHAYNLRAIETAALLRIPYTGGSDAHAPQEVGSCHTLFADVVTRDNFIALLKAGAYSGVDLRKISRKTFPGIGR